VAANLGGSARAFSLNHVYRRLLVMNTAIDRGGGGTFGFGSGYPRFRYLVTALTAIYSLAVGTFFLFGSSGLLPPLGLRSTAVWAVSRSFPKSDKKIFLFKR